jgi:hypothetical protein
MDGKRATAGRMAPRGFPRDNRFILAAYLAVVNLVLFAAGLMALPGGGGALQLQAAFTLSLFATLPLFGFALYRSRRYKAARTRWRGIRCAMEPGAWGYTWRWLGLALLTLLSLGLLLPLQTFTLEKFVSDRSRFGDAQLFQGGRWTMLYRAMGPLAAGVVVIGVAFIPATPEWLRVLLVLSGGVTLAVGAVHYQVKSFRLLAAHKRLGDGIRFGAEPSTGRVILILMLGLLLSLAVLVGLTIILSIGMMAVMLGLGDLASWQTLDGAPPDITPGAAVAFGVLVAVFYAGLLVVLAAVQTAYTAQQITAHIATHVRASGAGELARIKQRPGDDNVDADGFAAALDIGGGF